MNNYRDNPGGHQFTGTNPTPYMRQPVVNTVNSYPAIPPRISYPSNRSTFNQNQGFQQVNSPYMYPGNAYMNTGYPGNGYSGMQSRMFQGVTPESSSAFHSIASVVEGLSSITAMMESTYHAVYSSFHSVLVVGQQFSALRSRLTQIFSALTLIKSMKWLLHKLKILIGLGSGSSESLWNQINSDTMSTNPGSGRLSQKLYTYIFFALVYLGPYILWRIQSAFNEPNPQDSLEDWKKCVALAPYQARNHEELSLVPKQIYYLAPQNQQQDQHWKLVCDANSCGLVPGNYLALLTNCSVSSDFKPGQNPVQVAPNNCQAAQQTVTFEDKIDNEPQIDPQ